MEKTTPASFAASVRTVSRPRMWTPLRYVLTSAIPDPAASGSTKDTSPPATQANAAAIDTKAK